MSLLGVVEFVCPNVVNTMRLPVRGVEVREVLRTGGSQELFESLTHESDRAAAAQRRQVVKLEGSWLH